ncbi:TPA: hypothetical protein HA265_06395, partial [Candidatus Woesearchaeota archaeon]|nr:hypothetical protein [Candidatus Woesearchaeota archaeon]
AVVFAASAKVVNDDSAPGCTTLGGNCHSLQVNLNNDAVTYTVDDVQPDTVYTVSFMYKRQRGEGFKFNILDFTDADGDGVESGMLTDASWTMHSETFKTPGESDMPIDFKLRFFKSSSGEVEFYLDNIQMTEAPEPTKFNDFSYDYGCCPRDFCWTGELIPEHPSCIHDDFYEKNVSMPPIGYTLADPDFVEGPNGFLDAPNGFRCINGEWDFARAKFRPFYDGAGYCPNETQCFIGGSHLAELACVNHTEVRSASPGEDADLEYFYCYEGNWTTRTKEIALQLLNMANSSTDNVYTIFCDRYDRSLNPDELFSYYRDYVGENIVTILNSDMVNEFCVMELNGQVIAGVSLNEVAINETITEGCAASSIACLDVECDPETNCPENQPDATTPKELSFIQILKGYEQNEYCDDVDYELNEYQRCKKEDVYYNPKLRSVIFTKPTDPIQAVPIDDEKTFIEVVFDYLMSIIRDILEIAGIPQPQLELVQKSQLDFVEKAGSFDKLYISYSPDGPNGNPREIKAIRETRAHRVSPTTAEIELRTFITAEYLNYQSPICRRYFYKNLPNAGDDVIRQISQLENVQCTPVILEDQQQWMHSIYVDEPVFENIPSELRDVKLWIGASDTFWNDITAKIRTQAPPAMPAGAEPPSTPSFSISPTPAIVDTPVEFTIEENPDSVNWIATTWYFGDGQKASSAFNISSEHRYAKDTVDKDPYTVTLCVMNNNHKINCEATKTVDIGPAPTVTVTTNEQEEDRTADITVEIDGGASPYNIRVEWGDGDDSEENDQGASSNFEHEYDDDQFEDPGSLRKEIKIIGTDKDGAKFEKRETIIIKNNVD